jgi:hypothetical protein
MQHPVRFFDMTRRLGLGQRVTFSGAIHVGCLFARPQTTTITPSQAHEHQQQAEEEYSVTSGGRRRVRENGAKRG